MVVVNMKTKPTLNWLNEFDFICCPLIVFWLFYKVGRIRDSGPDMLKAWFKSNSSLGPVDPRPQHSIIYIHTIILLFYILYILENTNYRTLLNKATTLTTATKKVITKKNEYAPGVQNVWHILMLKISNLAMDFPENYRCKTYLNEFIINRIWNKRWKCVMCLATVRLAWLR